MTTAELQGHIHTSETAPVADRPDPLVKAGAHDIVSAPMNLDHPMSDANPLPKAEDQDSMEEGEIDLSDNDLTNDPASNAAVPSQSTGREVDSTNLDVNQFSEYTPMARPTRSNHFVDYKHEDSVEYEYDEYADDGYGEEEYGDDMYDEDYNEAETENHDASYGQDAKKRTKKKNKNKNNINIDVWDDSALIAAWDEAVEEYRRHHSLSAENKQESTEAPSVPSKRKLEIEQVETGISTNSTTSSQSPFKQPKIQHPPSSKPCNRPLSVKTTFAMSTSTTKTSTERADPFFPPGSPFTPTTQTTPQYPRTNNFKSPLQPAAPPTTPATPIVKSGTFSINENIKSTSKSKETVVPTKEAIEPAVHTSSTAASNVRPNLESASNLASMVQSQMPEQDEILNNLCMSWYWCGYYTALYSAQQSQRK